MVKIDITINKSIFFEVNDHLNRCAKNFTPILSDYVNINDYSRKIIQNATRIEAYHDDILVGLIAIYIDITNKISFITNVSVLEEYTGKGVATILIKKAIQINALKKIDLIRLKVDSENLKAISFYKKIGFQKESINENKLTMYLKP